VSAGKAHEGLAAWWGLLEADPLLVGVVVAAIALFAAVYVVLRLRRGSRRGSQ
jgi:hypothetical protein